MGFADLTGPRAKLERAEEHFKALCDECLMFVQQDTNFGRSTFDCEDGWYVVLLHPIPDFPLHIALIAGDCLNNIRAALDQLIWQLVLREDQEPGQSHSFPIYDTREEFIKKVETPAKKGKQKSPLYGIPVDGDAWRIIEAVQPFNNPQPECGDLALLAKFTNFDKHRTLLLQETYAGPQWVANGIRWRPSLQPIERRLSPDFVPRSREQPTEIARFRFEPGVDPGIRMMGNIPVEPTIGDDKIDIALWCLSNFRRGAEEILDQIAALPRVKV
jgi:hypothetical protein